MTYTIDDKGVIIALKPYGEASAIITLFSENHGLIKGYAKNAMLSSGSGTFQKGNCISFQHNRKTEDSLGYFTADSLYCIWSLLSSKKDALSFFNIICELLENTLPEMTPETLIFDRFIQLVSTLIESPPDKYQKSVCIFLLFLLQESGYYIDLTQCAVTGSHDNIYYVSPKTGQAISKEAGDEYHDKLLIIPQFLKQDNALISEDDIRNALKLIGFLLEKYLYHPKNLPLPNSFWHHYQSLHHTA